MALKKYHVSKQLFDKTTVTNNSRVLYTTGEVGALAGCFVSDYIPVISGKKYTLNIADASLTAVTGHLFALYDSSKIFVDTGTHACTAGQTIYSFTIPNGCAYIRFNSLERATDRVMFVEGEFTAQTFPSYEPYGNTWNDIPYRRYETATDVVTNLPVTVYGDGETNISLLLKGNTETSGTPSPQNPVTISGVGNETANLFNTFDIVGQVPKTSDGTLTTLSNGATTSLIPITNPIVTLSYAYSNYRYILIYDANEDYIGYIDSNGAGAVGSNSIAGYENAKYVRIRTNNYSGYLDNPTMMLNYGTIALPYEPHGYKISILKDSSPLTPMYFSQQLMQIDDTTDDYSSSGTATYKIARYEITGNEQWRDADNPIENTYCYRFSPTGIINVGQSIPIDSVCTHFQCGAYYNSNEIGYQHTNDKLYFRVTQSTVESFKQWLADLYAAGTPVTVWYILATPTTETVTAPTITTTGGEVTIDVDTTVKPSEMDLTYHGWHEHHPLKRENGQWV